MTIPHRIPALSCDCMIATAAASATGATLFAKNSDRPPTEPQPLRQFPRQQHAPGATVQVQYLEIPQVQETAAMLGSQPYWLWGFEHGVNEHRVAIGNEAIYTKDAPGETGLLGMDLVRLGLERGRTAEGALDVMVALIEEYGQGGQAWEDLDMRYNNSFLIADPDGAWILEASGKEWSARRVHAVDSISNHAQIGADWDRASATLAEHAAAEGWSGGNGGGKLDFAMAYRDVDTVPRAMSEGRLKQSRAIMGDMQGHATPGRMRNALRDHYDSGMVYRGSADPGSETYYSICMHWDPISVTTASAVAELPKDPDTLPVYWASMATPCTSVFLPLFLDGTIPEALGRADKAPSDDSLWWRCKQLQDACAADFAVNTPKVQALFHAWEAESDTALARVRASAEALLKKGETEAAQQVLTGFMNERWQAASDLLSRAVSEVTA